MQGSHCNQHETVTIHFNFNKNRNVNCSLPNPVNKVRPFMHHFIAAIYYSSQTQPCFFFKDALAKNTPAFLQYLLIGTFSCFLTNHQPYSYSHAYINDGGSQKFLHPPSKRLESVPDNKKASSMDRLHWSFCFSLSLMSVGMLPVSRQLANRTGTHTFQLKSNADHFNPIRTPLFLSQMSH